MIATLELWLLRLLAVTAVLAFCGYRVYALGEAHTQAKWDAANAQAQVLANAETARRQAVADQLRTAHEKEVTAISARLADALSQLRKRPERRDMPETPAAACTGATGTDLSNRDAEFLSREAARADGLRAALEQCYSWSESINPEAP